MARRDIYSLGTLETLLPSEARTVSGNSGTLSDFVGAKTIRAQVNVTVAAGTAPTLDLVFEDTLDGTNWNLVGTFAQRIATGREVINITTPFTENLRARWTIGGVTPSFTFSLIVYSEA